MKELLKLFEFTANKTQELSQTQSVTGEAMVIDGVTVVPVYKLSCGFAGGGTDLATKRKSDALAAGAGGKVTKTPLSFLALQGNNVQILRVAADSSDKVGLADALASVVAMFKEKNSNKNGAAK